MLASTAADIDLLLIVSFRYISLALSLSYIETHADAQAPHTDLTLECAIVTNSHAEHLTGQRSKRTYRR